MPSFCTLSNRPRWFLPSALVFGTLKSSSNVKPFCIAE